MLQIRSFILAVLLTLCIGSSAMAEGFAMTEWSARGLGLASGMVGRADDPSAIAYNAAGITQLPGLNFMAGASFVAPYGSIKAAYPGGSHMTSTKPQIWVPGHGYATYQLNDSVWLGAGMYTRFGLGNTYADEWIGKYNLYTVGLQTVSFVPTIAYKINDMFSVAAGLEVMYMSMYMGQKMHSQAGGLFPENDLFLNGSGVGFGYHLAVHAKLSEQWSMGLTYKSQVQQNISGKAEFANQFSSPTPLLPDALDTNVSGTIYLPDSVSFGITYKPLDNLSFEVGTVWTRWSNFKNLNIYFDSPNPLPGKNPKEWRDGWNINASVEYAPLDWLTLRAGYWHETAVTNEKFADYLMPTNGRDAVSLGVGIEWENWTVDLAYVHMWIYPTDYTITGSNGIRNAGISGGHSSNVGADIYSFSVGYKF